MSNVDRMCVRLLAVSLLPLVIAVPIATGISAFYNALTQMGAPEPSVDLPWIVALVAAVACLVLFAVQATRIWQWKEGKSLDCPACGCLLGGARDGRWGPYRRCLGCRTNHSEK